MSTRKRLARKDITNVQRSQKQKIQKEAQSLMQFIDLPDFDVSEFFQSLMRSARYEQVLNKIPKQKQIGFFARNFITFIQTQDELAQLKLPQLQQIPKAKIFSFDKFQEKQQIQNVDESSVLQIVDSFGAVVLQKNTSEIVRILKIIKEMKQHSRYQNYFNLFAINQLFRQSYETFLQTCDDKEVLLNVGQTAVAMKKYLKQKMNQFINKVRTDMNIDSTVRGVKKIMQKLTIFIDTTLRECKEQFPPQKISNTAQADIIIPKFLSELSKQFGQTIQPCIYEKEQLSEVLQSLQTVLESCNQLENKGINLSREFKQLISHDLPMHMNKIIQVVIQAFDDILKQDNSIYQFKYFDNLNSLGLEMQSLNIVKEGEYGKKCCSKKGILLINAFVIILQPLCDQKWIFLQQNVIQQLLQKVSGAIYDSNWHYWDYYQLFYFFDRFQSGKIKHKKLFKQKQVPLNLKEKMVTVNKIKMDCWDQFETKVTNKFWVQVLSKIPRSLWQIKQYIESKSEPYRKPTIFGAQLVFLCEDFLKNIQFRLQRTQFEYLIFRFYEYALFVIQYIIYFDYHNKGTKQKVFSLYQKSQKIFKKAKNFSIQQLDIVKEQKKIQTIGLFTQTGLKNFALDIYFFTEALKIMTQYQNFSSEQFLYKVSQIQSKEHKSEAVNLNKEQFVKPLEGSLKVYKEQPQKIKQYMERKKKELNKAK